MWPWGSQGEDGVNQIVSMGVDQEISDFLIGDLEIWPALDLIDMSIVGGIDVGSPIHVVVALICLPKSHGSHRQYVLLKKGFRTNVYSDNT